MSTATENMIALTAACNGLYDVVDNKINEIDTAVDTAIDELNTAKANIAADEVATAASRTNVEADETAVAASKANVDANETAINNTLATLQAATPETRYVQDITIGGSADYFYPVWWTFPTGAFGIAKLLVSRQYDWNGAEGERPLNPASGHQGHLTLEMEGQGYDWHGEANFLEIKRYYTRYNNTASHVDFQMWSKARLIDPGGDPLHGSAVLTLAAQNKAFSGVYLRGGGIDYRIVKNWTGNVNFHDGSDQLERVINSLGNTQWYAEPIDLVDELKPTATVNAFVDPV